MRLRDAVCLVFVAALFIGCRGQGFTFRASARAVGQTITVGITEAPGAATFECQLDGAPFVNCSDGFMFTSVAVGNHNVTVRGTLNGQPSQLTLPVEIVPQLTVTVTVTASGTIITVIIDSNMDATFECQLDSDEFIPCFSGFQYSGVSAGQHTVVVRANSTETGQVATSAPAIVDVEELAIQFTGTTGTQNITAQTFTFDFMTSEDFPVQCSIDGGEFVNCSAPYVVDTSMLSTGEHTITYSVTIDGVVRGLANQTFTVLEEVLIEFGEVAYSVVEGVRFYNITVVKQGEPGEDIVVSIFPSEDSTAVDTVESPSDYDPQGVQVIFTPGGPDEMTIQLQVNDDATLEADEILLLSLSLSPAAMESGGELGPRNEARVTIINDDMVVVRFFTTQTSVSAEESSNARFAVIFDPQDTEIPFTFLVETLDLSPVPDAEAGVDYQPLRRNVTLGNLQATENLEVTIFDDSITERTEEFEVRIVIPEETQRLGVSLGSPSVLTIRILDDDAGDLAIQCFTNVTGDGTIGRTIQLFFVANQDDVTFQCRLNDQDFVACTSPHIFTNVDFSEAVTVTVEGTALTVQGLETATETKDVFFAMGGLQVVGVGAIAVQLEATKDATYRCRLNDGEFVDCVDGQVFGDLAAGTYTIFIEATATNNTNEVVFDTVGPVLLAAGANATTSEAIAACFGRREISCDSVTNICQYVATWRTRGDRVEFNLVGQTSGWVGIGFSTDNLMPRSDIIVGAASASGSFVDDRYAEDRAQPPRDTVQDVIGGSASFVDGVTTVQFSRDKVTGDSEDDLTLSVCRYLLHAWGGNANVLTGVIQIHNSQNAAASATLICFPAPSLCPERFNCGDPGAPVNGNRSFTDTLEGSIVTYTCNDGFELVGNRTQTCELTSDGAFWSYARPVCRSIVCGDPGTPDNGRTTAPNDTVGSTAIHFCNDGYILVGASQRVCLANGSWSDTLPTCIIVDCGEPGTPLNGSTSGTLRNITSTDVPIQVIDSTFGSVVNHTCNVGFTLVGAFQRECLANGSWSAPLPTCEIIDCGNLLPPENGDVMVPSTNVGSIATYTCNTGYEISGVNERECLLNGTWSQDPPICILIDCGEPGIPDNGGTMQTTTTFGSIVNHTCDTGYNLNGARQRECLANGNWSQPLPTCVIVNCGDAGIPDNGNTMQTTTTFGSIVNHTCIVGYDLIGAAQRECLATGSWSEPLPECRIVNCGNPGTPMNGITMVESTTFGSAVTHTCNTGFALNGANRRECLASGEWSEPLPTCRESDCGDPGTPGNGSTFGDTYTFGSTVNHTCNMGFELVGSSQRECLANATWSGLLPTCEIIDCGDPGRPVDGTTTGTSTTFGSVVNHTCNEGFLLSGAAQRVCLSSAMWSAPLPSCTEVDCGNPGIPVDGGTTVNSTTLDSVAIHNCDDGFLLVGESQRICLESGEWSAPLPTCEPSRICQVDGLSIFPYDQTGSQISYLLRDVCEHTLLTTCSGSATFSVNADYSEESLNLARAGIQYNTTIIVVVIDDSGLSLNTQNLGSIVSQSGQTTEYPNQIFITQSADEIVIDVRRVGVRLTVSRSGLEVEVSSGALSGDFCGLCGRLNGELLYSDRTTIADITDRVDIQQFTNSWRADDMFLRDTPRNICSSVVKIRDPLFKVPIHIDQALIDANPALAEACLCYEVHGRDNSTFNLLSDRCTSVNAEYTSMANPVAGNIISAIGVTAIDLDGACHDIEANIDQCSVSVDGNLLDIGETFSIAGITVIRYQGRVKIAVPNCGRGELVLWFICKAVHNVVISEFIIARGVTLQPTSHGLVGQFWNIPIGVEDFVVNSSALPNYAVTVNAPDGLSRSFVGSLYERPWEIMLPCLFSGNRQGGATNAFGDPNESVIQGSYQDYEVSNLFDTDFTFSTFDSTACGKKK